MRDDELRTRLRERNPWWQAAAAGGDPLAWTDTDVTLRGLRAYDIGYDPPVFDGLEAGDLCVLRGPRRVGKSVAVKRFIARLLADPAIDPAQVIYLPVADFAARDLRRALTLGRNLTRPPQGTPRYWLFDEITAVRGWLPIIKDARDETELANDLVVLTGSSASDLNEARSALGAGRAGAATRRFRLLLPMAFRAYVEAAGIELPEVPVIAPSALVDPEARQAVLSLEPFVDQLDLAWQNYCEVGGYPRAVAESLRAGSVSDAFCRDLVDWLAPDVTPDEPQDSVLSLLHDLTVRMAAPLNERDTAASIGMSRERFRGRLNRLVNAIAAVWCPQVGAEGRRVEGSQSKLYLIDPLLSQLPHLIDPAYEAPDLTTISEAALGIALARAIENLHDGRLVEGRAIGYLRTGGRKEIDFASMPLRVGGSRVQSTPIESKWVTSGWRAEALTVENKYGHGILATKSILDVDGYPTWAVPAGILALLLD
jgi:hypothetical protein